MNCLNCDVVVEGKFCANCGQKSNTSRITLSNVMHELSHAVTHADKGFPLLVKQLINRPGFVAKEFLEGKRKRYFNPISFLVITSAFQAYVGYKTGYYKALTKMDAQQQTSKLASQLYNESMDLMINNGKLLSLIILTPLMAIFTWMLFRKPKYNLAETFVFQSFIVGEMNILTTIIFIPIYLALPAQAPIINSVFQLCFLVYLVVAFRQFYHQRIFSTIIKSILIMILFIVMFWVLIVGYVMIKYKIQHG